MKAILISAALILGGCTTMKSVDEISRQGCGSYEHGRLAGMRAGTKLKTPDPATVHGRQVIEEIQFLEALCEGHKPLS